MGDNINVSGTTKDHPQLRKLARALISIVRSQASTATEKQIEVRREKGAA